jgi:hypothetical protein
METLVGLLAVTACVAVALECEEAAFGLFSVILALIIYA